MENEIQKEIEEMTATVTASPSNAGGLNVVKMNWWQKIAFRWNTRKLPKAQRLLHIGFPTVTGKQLADRLGVTAFNAGRDFRSEVINACIGKKGHPIDECVITEVTILRSVGGGSCRWIYKGEDYLELMSKTWPSTEVKASVKLVPIDSYCLEKIPERCLTHFSAALDAGLNRKKIMVAYPVVEEVKLPDPIIVYKVNNIDGDDSVYLEITMWE